mmetsp:Transcript_15205/g.36179  ORF Transcript_15205/g.36179 Transcript_15205/m.36179 type:complete len:215 (+) Transcript_15205:658-1302(+)
MDRGSGWDEHSAAISRLLLPTLTGMQMDSGGGSEPGVEKSRAPPGGGAGGWGEAPASGRGIAGRDGSGRRGVWASELPAALSTAGCRLLPADRSSTRSPRVSRGCHAFRERFLDRCLRMCWLSNLSPFSDCRAASEWTTVSGDASVLAAAAAAGVAAASAGDWAFCGCSADSASRIKLAKAPLPEGSEGRVWGSISAIRRTSSCALAAHSARLL